MAEYIQHPPVLKNTYLHDPFLRSYLMRALGPVHLKEIEPGLVALGERAAFEILELGNQAEQQPPQHIPYDPWGIRTDEIRVSAAWKRLGEIAVEEKLISTAYERKHQAFSRIHQMVRVYLFSPSSAVYSCPLAMTDGAARAIEVYGDEHLKKHAFHKLTSADPKDFWTSGQWMTEHTGGSDVALSETKATSEKDSYKLFGTKYFTSATTAEMAMTLARLPDGPAGGKGLSLFYVEVRDEKKKLNNIFVRRLKDKMGTKALPTAELELRGTEAKLVGGPGDGIKKIATLFNVTRVWNACVCVSYMRRGLTLAQEYAKTRFAFGKMISEQPLHRETLANLEVEYEAAFLLVMRVAELLGREECKTGSETESAMLRILTPLAKLYTAKQNVMVSTEVMEAFGGVGYLEDTQIPRLLRDSMAFAIWEGTTNILSLDMLRAIQKENALVPLLNDIDRIIAEIKNPALQPYLEPLRKSAAIVPGFFKRNPPEEDILTNARYLAYRLSETYMAALLIEHAEWTLKTDPRSTIVNSVDRWFRKL